MHVFIEQSSQKKTLRFSGSVSALLSQLGINPEEVIVTRNGTLVTEDTKLSDTDDVKILSVISGG